MKLSADCMFCLVAGQQENIKHFEDEDKKSVYMREVLQIIVDSGPKATAPVVVADINKLHQATFGVSYSFEALKKEYNRSLLQNEAGIKLRIDSAGNKLLAAVKFARAGNYIDFGAMKQIDKEKLNLLLESAQGEGIDPVEFAAFEHDLQTAENLVYLLDNCGEIVLDKLLIQTIQNRYPQLHITVIARGAPVLNDATVEDAEFVGLTAIAEVMGNGTGIAGTQLDAISQEAKSRITQADMIIAKGQGNFETLHGCGLNIYYLFLCKCDWFVRRFRLERFKGVFLNEKSV